MALLRDLQQAGVELVVHLHQVLRVLLATQLGEQQAHELLRVAMGLEQERDARGGAEGFQQMEQHGGLAHAGLRDQADESAIGFDAVVQGSERFLMSLAEIKKARVRGNAEGLLAQSKKIQIHDLPSVPARAQTKSHKRCEREWELRAEIMDQPFTIIRLETPCCAPLFTSLCGNKALRKFRRAWRNEAKFGAALSRLQVSASSISQAGGRRVE